MKVAIVFLVLITCIVFSRAADDLIFEGIELLSRSEYAWFPLNILYFYTGLLQLSRAVSLEPYDISVRFARAAALFRFLEKPYTVRIIRSDLEFIVLYRDMDARFFESHELDIYYMLCTVRAIMKDEKAYRLCLKELSEIEGSEKYVEDLLRRYGP